MTRTLDPACINAREMARYYRLRGWNPLPSRTDAKRPLTYYRQWWEEPAPADLFDQFPTPNIQLMLGRRWRLMAFDLDGPEAQERWLKAWPRTWVTHSGGAGVHVWFRVPEDYLSTPLPKAIIWRGEGEHSAVERLCDRSLLMVPPSRHPRTGKPYLFRSKAESPKGLSLPAICPWQILEMPALAPPRPDGVTFDSVISDTVESDTYPHRGADRCQKRHYDKTYRARDVLDALGDRKIDIAASWGLRLKGRPQSNGWWPCHAFDREDKNPSAAIHRESGFYCDLGSGRRLGFFDLAAMLGPYPDWRAALNDMGERYGARPAA